MTSVRLPFANRRVALASAAALAAIVLVLGYLGAHARPTARNSPVENLRIAAPVLPHTALVHIAAKKGYFAEEGLDVSTLPVTYGGVAVDHVLQGKADLAVTAEVPFVISVMKGGGLGMVASLATLSNDNTIIARRDHGIAAPRDLAGKRIGVTFRTSGSYFLWAFLVSHKVAPESIVLVDLAPGRIAAALADGGVDAVATWQPISFQALAALGANALSFSEPDAYRTTMVVLGRSEFLKGHAGAMEKFVRAMLKAELFMRTQPEETLDAVAAWLKVDASQLRPTWEQFDFSVNLRQSQLHTLEAEARWATDRGYVAKGPVPNFLPHLYLDALLAVQPDRVTVVH